MFPWAISSTRDRVEPATSGTESPAAGAGGDAEAAGGGREVASRAAVLTPGEAPSPALPGAAPSCGPAGGPSPGEDAGTPGGPPADGSMMFYGAVPPMNSKDEFAVSLLLSSTVSPGAPLTRRPPEGGLRLGSAPLAGPTGGPRRCRPRGATRGPGRPAVVCGARPQHSRAEWRPAWQRPPARSSGAANAFLTRHRPTGLASSLTAALQPTRACMLS